MYNTFWELYFLQFSVHAQTTIILCDNLINMKQVTHCLVAWNSCPMHQYNVCDQLFPCIFNIVCAVHDVKFSLSSHPYMQWSVYTRDTLFSYIFLPFLSAIIKESLYWLKFMMTFKEVPKHVKDCVSIVFTLQCMKGWYDILTFFAHLF
jgi:hypothetical protein